MIKTHPAAHSKTAKHTSPRPNPYAAYQVVRSHGTSVVLVNAGKTAEFKVETHACPICRLQEYRSGLNMPVAYAHKRNSTDHCDECEGDRIAIMGIALERQGIPLGWGVAGHSREYERDANCYAEDRVQRLSRSV